MNANLSETLWQDSCMSSAVRGSRGRSHCTPALCMQTRPLRNHSQTFIDKQSMVKTRTWQQVTHGMLHTHTCIHRHRQTTWKHNANPIQSNSSMHHYECIALCKDISLHRGRFCARSLACTTIPRSSEDRSSWMFFIQVVRGRPGGRLQFSGGGSKMAWLASASSSIPARCPKKAGRRDLMMDESSGWLH